ncbi:MAG TPA: hypothetical protein VML01_11215 [Bryobacterales bacterium]|nr:hypothetical protein [Bryobacterales bacterium]
MSIVSLLSVYAIYAAPGNTALESALAGRLQPGDSFTLGTGQYLVAFGGTAKDLSDHLGVTSGAEEGPSAPAVILEVSGFYGSAAPEVWDWLTQKMGAPYAPASSRSFASQRT